MIQVAIAKFGKRGFDAVGTREIAAAAGTPMSSITYHFGGKEGLYLAAAEHIFDYLQAHVGPRLDEIVDDDADAPSRIAAICTTLRKVGIFMLGEESAAFSLFIGREQQDPTSAVLELMRQRIMPMMHRLAAHVCFVRPDLSVDQARAVSVYLFGMGITLRHSRASLGLMLEQDPLTSETQTMLLDQLEQSARAILTAGPLMAGPSMAGPATEGSGR